MKKFALAGLSFFLPAFAFAQSATQQVNSVQDLSKFIIDFINNVAVPLVFALAFITFIIGVFIYFIAGASNQEKRDKGKDVMIYGIIGFFAMVSVWGLVHILTGSVSLNNNVPTQGSGLPHANNVNVQTSN
ncbi:MAG: seg [Parcubacteria group bacterium]|nr:seg [Parcubacteria group bacterium]